MILLLTLWLFASCAFSVHQSPPKHYSQQLYLSEFDAIHLIEGIDFRIVSLPAVVH